MSYQNGLPERLTVPNDVIEAWVSGDRDIAIAWLMSIHVASIKSTVIPRRTPTIVAAALINGDPNAIRLLRNATKILKGELPERARTFFAAFDETREDADRLALLTDTLLGPERAAKARLEEEKALARAEKARTRPISISDTRIRLGATSYETDRWIADGRLPVVEWETFRNWGRTLRTSKHDPLLIGTLVSSIAEWRRQDEEAAEANRKAAAKDSAAKRAETTFRAGVAKRAGTRMDLGYVLVPLEIGPSDPSLADFDTVFLTMQMPWPADIVRGDSPTAKHRVESASRLETAIRFERDRLQPLIDDSVAQATKTLSHDGDTSRFSAHLGSRLSRLAGTRDGRQGPDLIDGIDEAFKLATKALAEELSILVLKEDSGLMDYAALFPAARAMKRRLILHVGPTNSGKTHDAVRAMISATCGTYLAPLRLMALETYDRLIEQGVASSMVTGEERLEDPIARHVSCTIEMADLDTEVDVAVVDEVQMILDPQRGWAWTQAVVGLPAREIHLTGSVDAIPSVTRVAEMTSDELVIVHHERKSPLEAIPHPIGKLENGDAIVAFSRAEVMRLRREIGKGRKVATVYGALGPEVRRSESRRFRSGAASVLIATDAIAMGLNLPIKRVLFSALQKYDGVSTRNLTQSEIRQIGGRAGRYGLAEVGQVGILNRSFGGTALNTNMISMAIASAPAPPRNVRLPVMPPWRAVLAVSAVLKTENLRSILVHVSERLLHDDQILSSGDMTDMLNIALLVQGSGLGLRIRFAYLGCPLESRSREAESLLRSWASCHAKGKPVSSPHVSQKDVPGTDNALQECESLAKHLSMYLWLAQRWPDTYVDMANATVDRDRVNVLIEGALARKSLARGCRTCGRKMPDNHRFAICESCFHAQRSSYRHHHDDDDDDDDY